MNVWSFQGQKTTDNIIFSDSMSLKKLLRILSCE
jgi:hypothetical protein